MKKNGGFVLVTGMVFLLIITLIVIYLLRTSILEEKMAANSIDHQRAIQAADAVLREAEDLIDAGKAPFDPFNPTSFSSACTSGLCANLSKSETPWTAVNWSTVSKLKHSAMSFYKTDSPYYVIELIAKPEKKGSVCTTAAVYRIMAKGVGSVGAESVVQSYYRNQPSKCPY